MSEDSDPFQCRLDFLALLTKLNASQHAIQKVANYAMRHRRLSEDLYSCLIEQLEQVRETPFFLKKKKSEKDERNSAYTLCGFCFGGHNSSLEGSIYDLTNRMESRRIVL